MTRLIWSPNAMLLGGLSQGCRTRCGCLCSTRRVGGLPSAEIAHILGLGEVAVRQRLSRARRQFQARYAGESGEVIRDSVAATEHRRACAAPDVGLPLVLSPRGASLAAGP